MADIFISYSSHDREKALSLAEELRSLGTSVWIDHESLDGAARWSSQIAQALDECKALILLVSKSSLASKNCVKEVTIAAESDKHILPIDLEEVALTSEFRYHLAGLQRVSYSNRNAIRRTIENLVSSKPAQRHVPTPLPSEPLSQEGWRHLLAVMFTDIKGYSLLMNTDEKIAMKILKYHNTFMRQMIESHEGRVVEIIGDAFLAVFESAVRAVETGIAIQEGFKQYNLTCPKQERFQVRIGLHLGDVIEEQGGIKGDAVNIASRIQAMAPAGGVAFSETIYNAARHKTPLEVVSLGEKKLKNIREPYIIYKLKGFGEILDPATESSEPDILRVAVLPFDDLSPKKDNGWFADGMMDELIGTLSAIQKLRVASRSEVIYYKKHRPKAKKIADDLKVRYLIEGSVRKAGEKIRITSSLTDMGSGEQLWMNNYNGTFDDVFAFQETVSKQIAEALQLKLTPQEEKVITAQPTKNTEAYELYLKGLEFHRLLTRDGYEKALTLYEAAVALDPKYVDAYIAIANVAATFYRECSRDLKLLERAEQNLIKAEDISGKTARTLWIHGEIEWQKGNKDDAEKILLSSLELDPKHHQTFNMLGNIYFESRKMEQAVAYFESALNIVETCQNYSNLITALSVTSDSEKLREISKKSIPIMEKHIGLNPDDFAAKVGYAEALYWAGQKEDSIRETDQLAAIPEITGFIHFHIASLYERFGNQELYIQSLKKSIDTGFREIEAFKTEIYSDPNTQAQIDELISYLEELIENEK